MSLEAVVHLMRWIELTISFLTFCFLVYYFVNYWTRAIFTERWLVQICFTFWSLENVLVTGDAIATRAPVTAKSFIILPTVILTAVLVYRYHQLSKQHHLTQGKHRNEL